MKKTILGLAILISILLNHSFAQNLTWAKTIGSIPSDAIYSMASDISGNVYVTGYFNDTIDFDPGIGTHTLATHGSSDIFVAKYDPSGNYIWALSYGNVNGDGGVKLAYDEKGFLYVTGYYNGIVDFDFSTSTNTLNSTIHGAQFILKLDQSGNFIWVKGIWGAFPGLPFGNICLDKFGSIILGGQVTGSGDFDPGAGTYSLPGGGFVCKLDSSGNFIWAKGISNGYVQDVCLDPSGNIAFTGRYNVSGVDIDPGPGVSTVVCVGGWDIYLVKLDQMGNYVFGKTVGGSGLDWPGCITSDSKGNIYYGGTFQVSVDFDPGIGTNVLTSGGQYGGFCSKIDPSGNFVWAIYQAGGPTSGDAIDMSIDPGDNLYVSGTGYIKKVNISGTVILTSSFGGSPMALSTNTTGVIYLGGGFSNTSNIGISPNVYNVTANGSSDIFFAKYSFCDMSVPASTVQLCLGNAQILSVSGLSNYTWQPGSYNGSSYTVNPIVNTIYTVSGVSGTCAISRTVLVQVNANIQPTVTAIAANTLVCQSFTTALIGSGADTYTWSAALYNGQPHVPSTSGTYTVVGTNTTNACKNSATVSILVSPLPTIAVISSTNQVCSSGTVNLNASGATTYSWSNGASGNSVIVTPTANTNYSVSGSNSVGCVSASSAVTTVSVFAKPLISVNSGSICLGKSFTINASGASTYTFSSGTNIVSPLLASTYSVTGTSAQGCVSSNTAISSVGVYSLPIVSSSNGSICVGQIFNLSPAGASTYTYSGGSVTVSPSSTTSYSITGASAQGCVSSNTAISTVTVYNRPVISSNSGSICAGQSFTIIPSGASSYTYSSGSSVVSPLSNSIYSVVGTSTDGCTSSNTAISTVSVYSNPVIGVNSGSICSGNSFTIIPNGAITYTYSSGTNLVSPSVTTNYSVTGTNINGCISTAPAIATVSVFTTPVFTVNSGSICSGSTFTMFPFGTANSYSYSSGTNIVNPSSTTIYSVVGSSTAGCISAGIVTATVTVNPLPVISASGGSVCSGQIFTIMPSGAANYTFSSGTAIVTPTSATSYSITGSSAAGCMASTPVIVNVGIYPNTNIVVSNGTICAGNNYTLNPSGAVSYTYSSGTAVVNPTVNTTYSINGTNGYGCVSSSPGIASIFVNPSPSISINSGVIFAGQTYTLAPTGALNYTYSSGSNAVSPTTNSTYTIIGSNASGCVSGTAAIGSVFVLTPPNISTSNASICAGQSATLSALVSNTAIECSNIGLPGSLSSGLIGYWPFCGNTNDATANGNNGVNYGATLTSDRFGNTNSAYSFNGTNNRILINPSSVLSPTNWGGITMSFWSNQPVNINGQPIDLRGSNQNDIAVYIAAGNATSNNYNSSINNSIWAGSTTTLSNSSWHLITVTQNYSTGVLSTYIDGILEGSTTSSVSPVPSPFLNIGSRSSSAGVSNYFNGYLDDVGIWNRALTSAEISQLYNVGAVSYSWTPGGATTASISVSPTTSTSYSCFVSVNGASKITSASITVNPSPTISVNSGSICSGKSFTLIPNGASNYTYSSGSAIVSPLINSSYTVTGSSAQGCQAIAAISSVSVNTTPTITVNSGSICAGNSFTIVPNGANTYTYSSGSPIVSPITNSNYNITGTSAQGCVAGNTAVSTVTVSAAPIVSINNGTMCNGSTYTLNPIGANSYSFSSGTAIVNPSVSTSYSISGANANGCVSSNTAVALITVYQGPTLSVNSGSILNGQTFTIVPNGAISYTYSSGASQVSPSVSTNYSVTGSNAQGCVSTIPAISSLTVLPHNRFIHVATTGNDVGSTGLASAPFQHIQNAINYAINGDTVLAHPGRYKENVLVSGKNIVLTSEYYITNDTNTINATIVDGDSITNALIINNSNSVLNGFTIERGYSNSGAGLKIVSCNSPTVMNCYIQKNVGYGDITTHGVHFDAVNGLIEKCKIRYNYGRKHTVWINGNSVFRNSMVYSNTAWEESNVVVNSSSSLYNLIIVNNQGGGLKIWPGAQSATLTNLTIVNNTGFGLWVWGLNTSQNTIGKISNSIIWGNNHASLGSPINPTLNIWISQSATPANSILYINHCLVQGGSTAISTNSYCILNYGTNNISSNPQFVSSTDYHLSNNSPAIGAGIASLTLQGTPINVPNTDYYGNVRPSPSATNPDLGAIENPLGIGCGMFVLTNDTSICAGSPLSLNITGANSNTWMPGNISTASVIINPSISTIYTVNSANGVTGCSFIQQTVSVLVNAIPSVNISGSNTLCLGNSVTLTASGANGYTWQPGGSISNTLLVSPTTQQSYSLVGKNAAGCLSNLSIKTISVYTNPTISASGGTICSGNSFTILPSGASNYTYSSGSAVVSPSVSSNYSVIGTNSLGCVSNNTAIVNLTVFLTPTISISNGSICSGRSYTMNPSGASSYVFSSGSNIVSPTITTNYSVVGQSTAGCLSNNAVITLTVNTTPTIALAGGTICSGQSFTLNPSGASSYSYSSGSNVVNPSATTVYSVSGSSTSGCISANAVTSTVVVNPLPVISISNASVCSGQSYTFNPTGAASYTYSSGNAVITPTSAANYSISGTSPAGCISLSPAIVNVGIYPSPTISIASGSICQGGTFTLNVNGAVSYTYSSGSAIVSPSTSTSYSVSGTNAFGCVSSSVAIATISVYSLPIISVNSGSICSGNSFTLLPTGAINYTFSSGSAIVSPGVSTNYSVTGSNAQGCFALNAAVSNITVHATPTISVNSGTICSGNSFTLIPSGAVNYTYSSGTGVVSPLSTSNYGIIGVSAQGCVSNNTAISNVVVNSTPTISVNSGSICSGNSFAILANGASTYTYSGGSSVVSPTSNTSYSVIGTSAQGCVSSNTAITTITVYSLPIISVNSGSICSGNSFTLLPSGATNYTYSSGSAIVSPNTSTNYTVTGSNAQGCTALIAAVSNITVYTTPTISAMNGTICSGNSFTLNPSGANTYTYSGGTAIVSPMSNTNYSITGTSLQGCVSNNTAIANIVVNPIPTVSVNSGSICSGNSFTLTPLGANSYTYSSGSSVVSPTSSTSYNVLGTSLQGCIASASATATITVYALPTISVNSGSICVGDSFTLSASGASTYTYSSGSTLITPSISSNYSVSGTSTNGCVSLFPAVSMVTVNTLPTISVNSGSVCLGEAFTITPNGANTYTFSSGSAIVTPTVNSTYSISGTSLQGCVTASVALSNVIVYSLPTISVNSGTICSGDSFTIIPNGANTYTYSSGINVVAPSISSNYTVIGSDLNGCKSANSAISSLSVISLPNINISGYSDLCIGESTKIKASGALSYTWNTGITTPTLLIQPTITTNYTVLGVNQNNCINSQTIQISISPCTQVKNQQGSTSLRIYPNPSSGKFTLEIPEYTESKIYIFNYIGQIIFEKEAEEKMLLDISEFDNGMYTLTICQKNNKKQTFKLVKQ